MKDDKNKPLLDQNILKDVDTLKAESIVFNESIEDINKEIDTKNVRDSKTLTNISNKFQNIKNQMEKINEKIQYLKNFLKDDSSGSQLLVLSTIKNISDNISKRYEAVNKKFIEKINNAKRQIEIEINSNNSDNFIIYENINNNQGQILQKIDSKAKMNIDRLKERQQDLEKVAKISVQLLELSRSMKMSAENQGKIVSSIEDHITISNEKVAQGNEQLNMRRDNQSSNIKLYFWICSSLGLILFIGLFMIYWKYWRINNLSSQT